VEGTFSDYAAARFVGGFWSCTYWFTAGICGPRAVSCGFGRCLPWGWRYRARAQSHERSLQAQARNALLPAVVEPVAPPVPVVFGPIAAPEVVSDAEFAERFRKAPTQLGSLSLGLPNRGFLFNARELQDSAEWHAVNPEHAFATEETILALTQAVHEVNVRFPATPQLSIGDLSDDDGGRISPHRSHQSGRDVDVGLYYSNGAKWYTQATPQNLDAARVWALIAGMYHTGLLEYVFFDRGLHAVLRAAAEQDAADAEMVQKVFEGGLNGEGPILRHARGHRTHLHARFTSPAAVLNATRAKALAGKSGARSVQLLGVLKRHAGQVATSTPDRGSVRLSRPAVRLRGTRNGQAAGERRASKPNARKRS
jgi:murein endopeptidase